MKFTLEIPDNSKAISLSIVRQDENDNLILTGTAFDVTEADGKTGRNKNMMQDEQEIPDFPKFKRGSAYWSVDDEFTLQKSIHSGYAGEKGIKDDEALYNAFHTEEYAQEFANKCKLIAMMLHCKWYLCRDFKGDYSDSNDKWVVYHCGLDNQFIATNSFHCDYGCVPFDTMENAQKCANWLNEHWRENDD